MTTQQDERTELIQFAKDHTIGGSEFNRKMAKITALLEADAKGGEAVAEWHLDSEAAQFLAELITADEDGPTEISLRVGQIKDDDGTVKHGLLVYETEYPEEGASLLVECPPLYNRPQQAAQVPLTDEQAEQLRKQWMYGEDHRYSPFIAGLRAAEAAHHIGKPKDVGINGLTEAETAASASVMGLTSKSKEQEK